MITIRLKKESAELLERVVANAIQDRRFDYDKVVKLHSIVSTKRQ